MKIPKIIKVSYMAILFRRATITAFILGAIYGSFQLGRITTIPEYVRAEVPVIVEKPLTFEEIPMLVKICQAESGSKQFKKNGDVIRGIANPSDIGFCQINEYINNDEARRLGYDIYTEKGNKDYAVWLYLHRGTAPWNSSKAMWSK